MMVDHIGRQLEGDQRHHLLRSNVADELRLRLAGIQLGLQNALNSLAMTILMIISLPQSPSEGPHYC